MPAHLLARDLGTVREFTISHPERMNALDDGLLHELDAALTAAEREGVRALILRGEGQRAFCAGYDLTALPAATDGALPDDLLGRVFDRLDTVPFPVLALIEGVCFGGGLELAARCDLRIATPSARFGFPPARLGIVYAPRGLLRLQALVGSSRLAQLAFAAEVWEAPTAQLHGLIDEVLPEAELHTLALARRMAEQAPLAIAGMRRTLRRAEAMQAAALEGPELRALRRQAFDSEDAKEGKAAFLEKRTPRFHGR